MKPHDRTVLLVMLVYQLLKISDDLVPIAGQEDFNTSINAPIGSEIIDGTNCDNLAKVLVLPDYFASTTNKLL